MSKNTVMVSLSVIIESIKFHNCGTIGPAAVVLPGCLGKVGPGVQGGRLEASENSGGGEKHPPPRRMLLRLVWRSGPLTKFNIIFQRLEKKGVLT